MNLGIASYAKISPLFQKIVYNCLK